MKNNHVDIVDPGQARWLKSYYFIRAGFSVLWVAAVFAWGRNVPALMATLLVVYPAWDAAANCVDAVRSGGLSRNRMQALNVLISLAAALAVLLALQADSRHVLEVFGAWAILSGLLQLGTAIHRWKSYGAQWAMILSGGQSALAGGLFIARALAPTPPPLASVAGYAAVGAFYFLISALWLTVGERRRKAVAVP